MKLTPEEIKQWNDAVSAITAICNKHCTEEQQCEDCPFDSMRFGEYGEPEYCAVRAGVLYKGEYELSPDDYLRNLREGCLRSYEKEVVIKSCKTCFWRNKDTNYCPELRLYVANPEIRMCTRWAPRQDIFEKEKS